MNDKVIGDDKWLCFKYDDTNNAIDVDIDDNKADDIDNAQYDDNDDKNLAIMMVTKAVEGWFLEW